MIDIAATEAAVPFPLAPEEQARADFYALVAHLLLAPQAPLLDALAHAGPLMSTQQDNPLDLAWEKLVALAALFGPAAIREEFDALFVSEGVPRFNPYESLYTVGFMMDAPLAVLREDLAAAGVARVTGAAESEDHLAALCETMRLLILRRRPLSQQKAFFNKHIAPWQARFFGDLHAADDAQFYRGVADFSCAFFAVEMQAFDIGEAGSAAETEFCPEMMQ
jgi:TorA maturation chaperone TorD